MWTEKKSVTIDICPETNLINFISKFVFNIEKTMAQYIYPSPFKIIFTNVFECETVMRY